MGLRTELLALILPYIYPVFFVFVFTLLRIFVTVFFATYLLLLIYSSALLKQCSGAIVGFSDSSSLFYVRCCSIFKCFYFNSSVCPIHLIYQREMSCHLFGKELLTRLIICNSVIC